MEVKDPPYRKKVYDLLSSNFSDFKRSEQEFNQQLDTDPSYADKVYGVLSQNFSDFKRPKEEFVSMLGKSVAPSPQQPPVLGGGGGAAPTGSDTPSAPSQPPSAPESVTAKPPSGTDRGVLFRNYWNAEGQARSLNEQFRQAQENAASVEGLGGMQPKQEAEIGRLSSLQSTYAKAARSSKGVFDRELDATVKEVASAAPLTMDKDGIQYADPTKVMAVAKGVASQYGIQDPEFEKVVYDRLLAHVDTGIIEKDAERRFEEKAKPVMDAEQLRMKGLFKTDSIEYAKAKSFIDASVASANAGAKQDIDALAVASKQQAEAVNASLEQAAKQYEQQVARVQAAASSGAIPQEQAQQQLDALYQAYQQQFGEAQTAIGGLNAKAASEVRSINQRYNRRFQEEQRRILEGAERRIDAAAEKFAKEYGSTPEGMAVRDRLRELQGEAWGDAAEARGKKIEAVSDARFLKQSLYGNVLGAMTARFGESVVEGLGGSFKGIAANTGNQSLYLLGEEMHRAFVLPETKSDSFSDLLDAQNFAQSTGQLVGGMLPSLAASTAAAAATGGASIPVQMLAAGAAGWGAETLDISGRARDDMYRNTGSREKADDAGWKSFVGQVQLMPAYAFEGLPFVGKALDFIPTKALRMGAAAGTEYGTELLQEIPQSIAEQNILRGKDAYEDFWQGLSSMEQSGDLKRLLVTMAPISLLGAGGQVTRKSQKQALEDAVKAYVAKGELSKYVEGAAGQWINRMIADNGKNFSSAVIASMQEGAQIDEATATELIKLQEQVLRARDESSRIGLGKKDTDIYTALSLQMNALRAQAEAEQSPAAKAVADKRAKEIEQSLTDFANEGKRQYVEVGFADKTSLLMDRAAAMRALKDPRFIVQAAMQGDALSLDFQGDEMEDLVADFQGSVMNVSDAIEKAKQRAAEGPIAAPAEVSAILMEAANKPPQIPIADDVDPEVRDEMIRAREALGVRYDPLNDLPEKVTRMFDRIEADKPVDAFALDEVSDWLYGKYKEVVKMRSDPKRLLTLEQIDSYAESLGEAITTVENYKTKLKENAAADPKPKEAQPEGKAAVVAVAEEPRKRKRPKNKRQPRIKINGAEIAPGEETVEGAVTPEAATEVQPTVVEDVSISEPNDTGGVLPSAASDVLLQRDDAPVAETPPEVPPQAPPSVPVQEQVVADLYVKPDLSRDVADDPVALASAYMDDHITHSDGSTLDDHIGTLVGNNVNRASFEKFGDVNKVTKDMKRAYLREEGGRELDDLAEELTGIWGETVTPEQIVDYIIRNPTGRQAVSPRAREIASGYYGITGKRMNSLTAKMILGMNKDDDGNPIPAKRVKWKPAEQAIVDAALAAQVDLSEINDDDIADAKNMEDDDLMDMFGPSRKGKTTTATEDKRKKDEEAKQTQSAGADETGGKVRRAESPRPPRAADPEEERLAEALKTARAERDAFVNDFNDRGQGLFAPEDIPTRQQTIDDTIDNSKENFDAKVEPLNERVRQATKALADYVEKGADRAAAAAKQTSIPEAPAATPTPPTSFKRPNPKPVKEPTVLRDVPSSVETKEYAIQGFEEYPVVVFKDKGGWKAVLRVGGLDMEIAGGQPTHGIAAGVAHEKMSRHGKKKLDDIVESLLKKGDGPMEMRATSLPPTITIDGKERSTTNSNGKPLALTEEGVRNFWNWFGDSKVVDEQGRPLVVYHGSDKQIDEFMQSGTGEMGRGMYFTKDKKEALDYAYGRRGDSEVVHEVYLKMDNPIKVKDAIKDLWDKYSKKGESDDVMTRAIQAKGHDGIVLTTPEVKYDNFKRKYQKTGKTREHIVVWQPTQIKSATGNSGAFDPKSPDITQQRPTDRAPKTGKPNTDKAMKALQGVAPGFKVIAPSNKADYQKAIDNFPDAVKSSWGLYDQASNTAYINPEGKDARNTLFHESGHPLLIALRQNQPEKFKAFYESIEEQYKKYAKEKYGDKSENTQQDEGFTQFLADVADGTVPVSTKPDGLWQKFKAFIQDLLASLGWDTRSIDMSQPTNVREFAVQFKKAMDKGIKMTGLTMGEGTQTMQQRPKTTKASEWNAAVDDAVKNAFVKEQDQAIQDAANLIMDPDGKAEFIKVMSEAWGITTPPTGTKANQKNDKKGVKKTLSTVRAYEGEFREEVKAELEKSGLYRSIENQEEAEAAADAFIAKVGIDAALEAARSGDVRGGARSVIRVRAAEALDKAFMEETDPDILEQIAREQAELIQETSQVLLEGGREAAMMNRMYATSDLGFHSEKKAAEWEEQFGEKPSDEMMAKWKERDKEFAELKQQLADAQKRAEEAEEKATIAAIEDSIARDKAKNRTYAQKAKVVADKFRRLKGKPMTFTDADGNRIDVTQMGFDWNALVELGAKAIEKTGQLADGIAAIAEYLKNAAWFAALDDRNKAAIMQQVEDAFDEVNEEDVGDGRIRIPKQMIRAAVEAGAKDINTLVAVIKEQIREDYPDATDREIRDAITDYGKVVNMNRDDISTEIRRMRRMGRILSALEDVQNKKRPLRSGLQRDKLDAEERALNKQLKDAMKDLPVDAEAQQQELRTALDAAKTRARNRIEDLQREIDTKELIQRNTKQVVPDAELKALIAEKDALQEEHDRIFEDKAATEQERLNRAIDAARRSVEKYRQRIADRNLDPTKPSPVKETPELRAERENLERAKAEYKLLQEEAGVIERKRLETAKKIAQGRIEDLRRRLDDGDFSRKATKPVVADTELVKLNARKIRLKEEYEKEFYKHKLESRTPAEKAKDFVANAWNLPRAAMATAEWSFVLMQGGALTISNLLHKPDAVGRAFKNMWRAMGSEQRSANWLQRVKAQEWYPTAKEAKLAITEPHGEATAREELFFSDWTKMIWNALGSPLLLVNKAAHQRWALANPFRAIERGSVAYLDTLRVERFLDGMAMLERNKAAGKEVTKQDYRDVADTINTLTGRASLGVAEPIAKGLTKVFFSPRLWASSIKTATPWALHHFGLFGLPLKNSSTGKWEWKSTSGYTSTARKMALQDLGRFIGTTMGFVAMAAIYFNNDDDDETGVETDMRSSDFGKIKIGDIRIDPWGGRMPQLVFSARLIARIAGMDAYKSNKGQVMPLGVRGKSPTLFDAALDMAMNKLNPAASFVTDWARAEERKDGKLYTKYGQEYDMSDEAIERLTPIYFGSVNDLMKEDPGALEGFLLFYAFFGGGVQIYEPKKKKGTKSGSSSSAESLLKDLQDAKK